MQNPNLGLSMAASYGLVSRGMPSNQGSELHQMGRPGLSDVNVGKAWHPDSPLFWLGALGALTLGLAAISGTGSVRVGPVHASASAGAGKK